MKATLTLASGFLAAFAAYVLTYLFGVEVDRRWVVAGVYGLLVAFVTLCWLSAPERDDDQ